MDALNIPRPAWMTEDLVMLEDQARRFIDSEFVPHLDRWNDEGMYGRDVWTKAGAAGLLCPAIPEQYGGAGGSFAHEAVINRALSLAGFELFGVQRIDASEHRGPGRLREGEPRDGGAHRRQPRRQARAGCPQGSAAADPGCAGFRDQTRQP